MSYLPFQVFSCNQSQRLALLTLLLSALEVIVFNSNQFSIFIINLELPSPLPQPTNSLPANFDGNNNTPKQDKQIYYIHDESNCESANDHSTNDVSDESVKSLWTFPTGNWLKKLWWLYTWPIKFILTLTIPNPKTFKKLYPLSFALCIVWIGVNSYLIVWMVTVVGELSLYFNWI